MIKDDYKFKKFCGVMFGILLLGVVVNFGLNTAATVKRQAVGVQISKEHHRLEQKLDKVDKKLDILLERTK